MVQYRRFRNTDPPALVEIWNEALTGRGAVRLGNSSPLESCVFAKPYFDPAGLILAEDEGVCVGFAHAGFGANADESAQSFEAGVTCILVVRSAFRRRGIGAGLLRHCEDYLRGRGAKTLFAGQRRPLNPFYVGLYGGSDAPGFLQSDTEVEPFLLRHGYRPGLVTRVFQRRLTQPVKTSDPRFAAYRQRFELKVDAPRRDLSWWQECVFGLIEPLQFGLVEKASGAVVARALVYELEGFSLRWNQPAVGVVNLEVGSELRRQGLGKFLLAQILRYVQDQCFEVIEYQASEDNPAALKLCQALGFEQVDLGRVYQRQD